MDGGSAETVIDLVHGAIELILAPLARIGEQIKLLLLPFDKILSSHADQTNRLIRALDPSVEEYPSRLPQIVRDIGCTGQAH